MNYNHSSWNQHPKLDDDEESILIFGPDYYQRAFLLFHYELETSGYNSRIPHPIRKRFWNLLPYRTYSQLEITPFIHKYIEAVERELNIIISKNSLAYWLHLYRRVFPGAIGLDSSPMTIGETRATLESAIQKYAQFHPCNRVGISGQTPIDEVLGGLLMDEEFELERENIQTYRQLVLTDFTTTELREFYDVERLAYELWRSSAMLRIVGKGSEIIVDESATCVYDSRSDELDQLVKSFDSRNSSWDYWLLSSKGLVFDVEKVPSDDIGAVFLPTYNLGGTLIENFNFFFNKFGIHFSSEYEMKPNFVWLPYFLRQYRESHSPFDEAFRKKHGVGLDAVLLIIATLCNRLFFMWSETEGRSLIRYWQRAYEGPYKREYVLEEIQVFMPLALEFFGLSENHIDKQELLRAIHYWELDSSKQQNMDLAYSGPHSIFLPYGKDRLFIDYVWINRRLYDLFVGVNIPDQNFKGDALELLVKSEKSVLPPNGCKLINNEMKQFDSSYKVGTRLVIVECKAIGKSIGFSRGDPQSIKFRINKLDIALKEVDEKAQWLCINPIGTNFDISEYVDILPIVVTPFVEYIPSLHSRYWISDELPRIITPTELKRALDEGTFAEASKNVISIQHDQEIINK